MALLWIMDEQRLVYRRIYCTAPASSNRLGVSVNRSLVAFRPPRGVS